MRAVSVLLLFAVLPVPLRAAPQAPIYDAQTIACARFAESVQGTLASRYGTEARTESFGRDGILVLQAVPDSGALSVVAWYDTLAVFREGPEGRFSPETDGILGGRYRGTLDPQGYYVALTAPFVPAGMREIFDFARLPLHFFPPLPPGPIRPGGEWTDGTELTLWRLADSVTTTGPVARYRWIRREVWEEGVAVGDSTIVVHRTEREDGGLQWKDGTGPLGWASEIVAGVEFPSGAGRSEVTQQVRVRRLTGACPGP